MNGMVNASLRDRVKRSLHDVRTYDRARLDAATGELGDDAIAILTAEDAVRSIVGYVLMDARRLNKSIDSLALDHLITREASSVGLRVDEGWFQTTEPSAPQGAEPKE
jgi:hypothetical protein